MASWGNLKRALALALAGITLSGSGPAYGWSSRVKRFGAYLSSQGDPFPSRLGLNLAYKVSRVVELHAGYGIAFARPSSGTVAAGIKASVPKWTVSPFLGLSYAQVLGGATAYSTPLFRSGYRELPDGVGHVYASGGFGYLSAKGWFARTGVNYSLDPRFSGLLFFAIGKLW